jgi:hypothetical protein
MYDSFDTRTSVDDVAPNIPLSFMSTIKRDTRAKDVSFNKGIP